MRAVVRRGLWLLLVLLACVGAAAWAEGPARDAAGGSPVWLWPLLLFLFCVVLGAVAVVAGVGGGILYVPLVNALFPFHLDFVRGAGLSIALAGSLASGPHLLERRLTSLHLTIPSALMVSLGAAIGAHLGLQLPRSLVETLLGLVVLAVAVLMLRAGSGGDAPDSGYGPVAHIFRMEGRYADPTSGEAIEWHASRARYGLPAAFAVGILGGLFGVGAGWANVPIFNLLMGIPLKIATASSVFLISVGNVSAVWIYFHQGSILAYLTAPSIAGLMLGSQLGVRLLDHAKPASVRRVVLLVLLYAGARALLDGLAGMAGGGG